MAQARAETPKAWRWRCPLLSCNQEQSRLFEDNDQCLTEFKAHLTKHSIEHAIDFILATAKWSAAYILAED